MKNCDFIFVYSLLQSLKTSSTNSLKPNHGSHYTILYLLVPLNQLIVALWLLRSPVFAIDHSSIPFKLYIQT